MGFAPREQNVERGLAALFDKVSECLDCFLEMLDAYLAGDEPEASLLWERLDGLESDADVIRRGIVKTLYEGAFLPLTREDIMAFVEAVDRIANAAESVADAFLLTKPSVPQAMRPKLQQLARESVAALPSLREATDGAFNNFTITVAKLEEVGRAESKADETESRLMQDVFDSDIELSRKLLLRELILKVGHIADRTENAGDRLQTLVVKQQF